MSLSELTQHPFQRASSLAQLCQMLSARARAGQETVLLAGGTDWIVERHLAPPAAAGELHPLVIDISRVEDICRIEPAGDTLRIGAAVTYLELRRNPLVQKRLPLLPAMCKDVGAVQIQARGTLGGNLATASPAADGVAALQALDARIVLVSSRGVRSLPLEGFYTGYKRSLRAADEIILRVDVKILEEGHAWYWRKVGTRQAQAISKVALAGVAEVEEGRLKRLGLGMASVAPTTVALPSVRALGLSTPLASIRDEDLDEATLADISPIDDIRSTATYRRHVACALVRGFFRQLS